MPRRSRAAIEDDEPVEAPSARRRRSNSAVDVSDAAASDVDGLDASYSSHEQMVKKLVRLALAHEVSRKPIRRQEISEKVLGSSTRAFKAVLDEANKQLQNVFGVTMTELPQKEKVTVAQKRQAQRAGAQSQGASTNSNKSYIVTSTLGPQFRKPSILQPMKTPSLDLEAQYTGLYTWIITVIMLSNSQRISENKLDSYLSKMNAGDSVAGDRTERILKRMEREGYITKIKDRDGGGEEIVDWIVGPRGKMEVGETGTAGMVRAVYGAQDDDLRELEDRLDKSLGEGTFRRKTRKGGAIENGDGANEAAEDAAGPSTQRQGTQRRSTRRSGPVQGETGNGDDEEGEEEDEEEEDD